MGPLEAVGTMNDSHRNVDRDCRLATDSANRPLETSLKERQPLRTDSSTLPAHEPTTQKAPVSPPPTVSKAASSMASPVTPTYYCYNPYSNHSPRRKRPWERRATDMGMSLSMQHLRERLSSALTTQQRQQQQQNPCNDDDSVSSDEVLERWSREIRTELRTREMMELALEAERAADAGHESFVGKASRFGDSDGTLVDEAGQTSSSSSSSRPMMLRRRRSDYQRTIRVLALRDVSEVIPSFRDLHCHLRTQFSRGNVDPETLEFKEVVPVVRTQQQPIATATPSSHAPPRHREGSMTFLGHQFKIPNWVSDPHQLPPNNCLSPACLPPLAKRIHGRGTASNPIQLLGPEFDGDEVNSVTSNHDDGDNNSVSSQDIGDLLAAHIHTPPVTGRKTLARKINVPPGLRMPYLAATTPPSSRFAKQQLQQQQDDDQSLPPPPPPPIYDDAATVQTVSSSSEHSREAPSRAETLAEQGILLPVALFDDQEEDAESVAAAATLQDPVLQTPVDTRATSSSDFVTPARLRKIRGGNKSRTTEDVPFHLEPPFLPASLPNRSLAFKRIRGIARKSVLLPPGALEPPRQTHSMEETYSEPILSRTASRFTKEDMITMMNGLDGQFSREIDNAGREESKMDPSAEDVAVLVNGSDGRVPLESPMQVLRAQFQQESMAHQQVKGFAEISAEPAEKSLHDNSEMRRYMARHAENPQGGDNDTSSRQGYSDGPMNLQDFSNLEQYEDTAPPPIGYIQTDDASAASCGSLSTTSIQEGRQEGQIAKQSDSVKTPAGIPCECLVSPASSLDSDEAGSPRKTMTTLDGESKGASTSLRRVVSLPSLPLAAQDKHLDDEMKTPEKPKNIWNSLASRMSHRSSHPNRGSIQQAAIDMISKLSPRSTEASCEEAAGTAKNETSLYVKEEDNKAFLNNYLYCGKPEDSVAKSSPKIETAPWHEPCRDDGVACEEIGIDTMCQGFAALFGSASRILPRRHQASSKEFFSLNADDYSGIEPETWFDIATERFDGVLEGLIGSAREQNHNWTAPSLKVRTPRSGRSGPQRRRGSEGMVLFQQAEDAPSHRRSLSDAQFELIYGVSRETFTEMSESQGRLPS